jgi:hypothetical protein
MFYHLCETLNIMHFLIDLISKSIEPELIPLIENALYCLNVVQYVDKDSTCLKSIVDPANGFTATLM